MGARGPKQEFTDEACPNKECGMYGRMGKGNVVGNGTYVTRNGRIRKLICHNCETTYTSRNNTAFFDFKTKDEKIMLALKIIVHKNSIRGVAEMLGVKPDTVCKWLRRAAEHSREVNKVLMREMDVSKLELDALWTIIQKERLPAALGCEDEGAAVWVAFDPLHKVVVSHLVGERQPRFADRLLRNVAQRICGIPDFFSDGLRFYLKFPALLTMSQLIRRRDTQRGDQVALLLRYFVESPFFADLRHFQFGQL